MMPESKDKKPKWGGLFHKDRPDSTADSTYGSDGSRNSYNNGNTPSMTESNASQRSNNGNEPNQYVNDQGQVVTTTTTTTTTTTSGGNSNANSSTTKPHDSGLANKLDPRVNTSDDQSYNQRGEGAPHVPPKSNMRRDPSPNPTPQQIRQANATRAQPSSQYDRGSGLYGENPAQGGHNFSYPSRANGGNPNQPQQPGTMHNLKAAAVGVHGAGETVRGTFNSAVDRRFNQPPDQVAAHNQTANSGRMEMDSGQLSNDSRQAGGVGTTGLKGILRKS